MSTQRADTRDATTETPDDGVLKLAHLGLQAAAFAVRSVPRGREKLKNRAHALERDVTAAVREALGEEHPTDDLLDSAGRAVTARLGEDFDPGDGGGVS